MPLQPRTFRTCESACTCLHTRTCSLSHSHIHTPLHETRPCRFYHAAGAPSIHLASDTSLDIRIGPPTYDGGDPLTNFKVEWDVSPEFNSATDGGAMYSETIDAFQYLCTDCVDEFDLDTNTFRLSSADSDDLRQLVTGARVAVVFEDDSLSYTFTVAPGYLDGLRNVPL